MILALKGRIRSNQAIIRYQSYFNIVGIESRTDEDHEEVNILLQNHLISSRFNQELGHIRRASIFIRDFGVKIMGHLIR